MRILLITAITLLFMAGCAEKEQMEMTIETPSFAMDILPQESAETEPVSEFVEPDLLTRLIDPQNSDLVRVIDYIPDVFVELKYSTADNFTGHVIYEFEDVFLRYGTVMKLKAVSKELADLGLYLKIWDGFRPVSAQFKLWEICPDDTYVANPHKGFSNHSRGFAVDVTLVDSDGREVEMPTGFDDFSSLADRDYSDCVPAAAENAKLLESVMEKHGFSGYRGEWWHFNDTQKYEVENCFDPAIISRKYTDMDVLLLKSSDPASETILEIPAGDVVTLLGYDNACAMVEFWGYRGYVAADVIH